MRQLFKIELIKTLGYPTFRTLIILYTLLLLVVVTIVTSININIQGINVQRLFYFPFAWDTFAWIAKWFNLLLGILTILIVTNEFLYRTFRKQLIDGLTRSSLLWSKLIVISLLSAYSMLLIFLTSCLFGAIKTPNFSIMDLADGLRFIPVLYLQTFSLLVLAMLFAFLLRNQALAIVSYVLFYFPIEPLIGAILPDSIDHLLPVKAISNLTPAPDFIGITLGETLESLGGGANEMLGIQTIPSAPPTALPVIITIGYSVLFILAIKRIIAKRNF